MKLTKIASAIAALSLSITIGAQAQDSRYVIQVDNNNKGIIKALAVQSGAKINVDGEGFFAATFAGMDLNQVKGVLNNPHVQLIESDQRRSLQSLYSDDPGNPKITQLTPYAVYQSQADQVSFVQGTDTKVCIIDSGLDRSNQDFNWTNISGDYDAGTGNWDINGGPHGTHVAGTIAASDNEFGVVGMAPGVSLHIIKVFTERGWAYSSDLAHATNLCSQAGANIINMSLGGGGSNTVESNAFSQFTEQGGLVVAAAGNDGNSIASYPAAYPAVMMIGANDADNNIAEFSQFPSCSSGRGKKATKDETICVEATAGGVQTLSTYPADMASIAAMSADGTFLPSAGMENQGDVTASTYFMSTGENIDTNANGSICLIDRGIISFHDKVANCEASGGIGAIIINNVDGVLYGTLGDANSTSIPTVGADLADRDALLNSTSASVTISTSDYGYMSGTSMATPAVAGVAALVWSNFPECSGEQIRTTLKKTAQDQGAPGHDVYFGYGIVQAKAAVDYLSQNGCADTPPPQAFSLDASYSFAKGKHTITLVANGGVTGLADLYRNGNKIATVTTGSEYLDTFSRKISGSYRYKACEENTTDCTSEQIINF
ncbi:S8 family serine peptidase [Thalassotalea sp. G2M2-11]|uniref:S8 family serine peptidase n=1 Tax=Thalassotalea sp. G2M2-11 TaxID=2787627 RepID=UPI0019D109F2|nr:S8 family serine peptidase [Thalassotalea sp. G2M2-11]